MSPTENIDLIEVAISKVLEANGDLDIPAAARKLNDLFWKKNSQAYMDWLSSRSYESLYRTLLYRNKDRRRSARTRATRDRFGTAVRERDLSLLTTWRVEVEDGVQRPVGKMTRADNQFAASCHETTSNEHKMLAAFHLEVARKQGERLVEEVFDDDTFLSLYQSIVGRPDPLALAA